MDAPTALSGAALLAYVEEGLADVLYASPDPRLLAC